MKNRELLNRGTQLLLEAGIEEASQDAWVLFSFHRAADRTWYLLHMEEEAPPDKEMEYLSLIEKRCTRLPVQYITGEQDFMGLEFRVSPAVLIPRQDTEILVEECLKRLPAQGRILDMCTGSGCILISLLHYGNQKQEGKGKITGLGVDISGDALSIAEENARENHVDARFLRSDLFEQVEGLFDMIVSNPPYIATEEILTLMPEVQEYEPRIALDGTKDGLHFYREIVRQSTDYLKEEGWLCFEIGYEQAEAVSGLMEKQGYKEIQIIKDLSGLDRVVVGRNRRKGYV